jgi:hypothetical protein
MRFKRKIGVIIKKGMRKLQKIYESTQEINFLSPQKEFSLYWHRFQESPLGKMHQSIPWHELSKSLKLRNNHNGRESIFTSQGKLALMFLKAYTSFSDRKLIENLNGNLEYQLFCGIFLGPEKLVDYKIVSRIRTDLAKHLKVNTSQQILAQAWKPYMKDTQILMSDATCYESDLRYPTNVKLLWESVEWLYGQMKLTCKYLKVRLPRSKYNEQSEKYYSYSRKRRKSHKDTRVRTRSLLHLLEKLIDQQENIVSQSNQKIAFSKRYTSRFRVIKKVLTQQQEMFETGESVPERIVSIDKAYIRPIIRGKEVKKVEFGAKVNMIQIDGINFIEHLSFNAFNEGTRLKQSIHYGRILFDKITHFAGDDIYATNANRTYCTSRNISTNFKRKGRAGKHEEHREIMASILRKERATRMEGSFGTEKQHYSLDKIKARTELNEILWIFFGVHTANAVRISKHHTQVNQYRNTA